MPAAEMKKQLEEMIGHNMRLIRTARSLHDAVGQGVGVVDSAMALAEPIAGQHEKRPTEYVLPAREIDALRAWLLLVRTWGMTDAA